MFIDAKFIGVMHLYCIPHINNWLNEWQPTTEANKIWLGFVLYSSPTETIWMDNFFNFIQFSFWVELKRWAEIFIWMKNCNEWNSRNNLWICMNLKFESNNVTLPFHTLKFFHFGENKIVSHSHDRMDILRGTESWCRRIYQYDDVSVFIFISLITSGFAEGSNFLSHWTLTNKRNKVSLNLFTYLAWCERVEWATC